MATVAEWLGQRGLRTETITAAGLMERTGQSGPELIIPCTGYQKIRPIGEKTFRAEPSGVEHDLFQSELLYDDGLQADPVVITEGELDAISCIQAGYSRAISVPDGWTEHVSEDSAKLRPILKHADKIRSAPKIIAAVDNDNVGKSLLHWLRAEFNTNLVAVPTWPDGCKDANDVLRLHGDIGLKRCLDNAVVMDPQGGLVTGFSDLPPQPQQACWKTGVEKIDNLIAFRSREISVLTGRPGAGKTTFSTWLMERVVQNHGIRVCISSFETDAEEIRDHLVMMRSGSPEPAMHMAGHIDGLDRDYRIMRPRQEDDGTHGIMWLTDMIRTVAQRDGCRIVVIDPWNELDLQPERNETMTQFLNWALAHLYRLARSLDIHICVVAHPKKMRDDKAVVAGYDISDSAAWFNKPAGGYTISQEDDEDSGAPMVRVTTWKVRSRRGTGTQPGYTLMSFDPHTQVYRTPY